MYNGRIGWGFLFGGIVLNFCCCVFVCACFELSICLLGSSSNKNRCWLKHLGSRRTPRVPYRPWFSIFQHGKKTFRSRFTRKWTRNRIIEEDVPLWRIHFSRASLRRAPAMPSWLSTATNGQLRWENPQTGYKKVRDHTFSSKTCPNGEKRLFEMLGRVESTSLRQICEGHRWQGLSAKQRLLRWCTMDRPSTRTRRLRGSFVTNGNQVDFAVKEWKRHGPNRVVTVPEELHQKILSGDHQQSASVDCVFL